MKYTNCKQSAIPPLGETYEYKVIVDDSLINFVNIYFEAGVHTNLVHIDGMTFFDLLSKSIYDDFSARI